MPIRRAPSVSGKSLGGLEPFLTGFRRRTWVYFASPLVCARPPAQAAKRPVPAPRQKPPRGPMRGVLNAQPKPPGSQAPTKPRRFAALPAVESRRRGGCGLERAGPAIRGYLPGKSSESTSDKANSALSPSSRSQCAGSGCRRSQAMHALGTLASSAKRYRCGAQVAIDQSLRCLSSQKLLAICGTFGHSAVGQYRRGVQVAIYQPLRRSASQKLLAICGTFGHSAAEQISVSLSRR